MVSLALLEVFLKSFMFLFCGLKNLYLQIEWYVTHLECLEHYFIYAHQYEECI